MIVCLFRVRCSGTCRRWLSEVGPVLAGELAVPTDFGSVGDAVDAAVAAGWQLPAMGAYGVTDLYCPACSQDLEVA